MTCLSGRLFCDMFSFKCLLGHVLISVFMTSCCTSPLSHAFLQTCLCLSSTCFVSCFAYAPALSCESLSGYATYSHPPAPNAHLHLPPHTRTHTHTHTLDTTGGGVETRIGQSMVILLMSFKALPPCHGPCYLSNCLLCRLLLACVCVRVCACGCERKRDRDRDSDRDSDSDSDRKRDRNKEKVKTLKGIETPEYK